MGNPYLQLLEELGIHVDETDWNRIHEIEPAEPPPSRHDPSRPQYRDETGKAVFFESQLRFEDPEDYGYDDYQVVEDDWTAHPFALNYQDEVYYRGNWRAKHRYSRPYRIRWTFTHLIGLDGKLPPHVAEKLQAALPAPFDVLQTRSAHEWVRDRLKAWGHKELYLSIPFIVAQLGGPRWRLTMQQTTAVYEDALKLHRVFDCLRNQGRLQRQRFPKMQYVLLKLMDHHGVVAPYRIPWARTSIKRRQLREFLTTLREPCLPPSDPPPNRSATPVPSEASPPSSPTLCDVTCTWSDSPDNGCRPANSTPLAGCTTTRTTSEGCTSAAIPSPARTCSPGPVASIR